MKRCPYCAEEIQLEAVKCKHCGSWLSGPQQPSATGDWSRTSSRRLTRTTADRMICGVCSGIARYIEIDPTIIRIVYAVVTVFTALFPGLLLYLLLAIIIPAEQ